MRSVAERLCAVPGRGACTDAERRAAVWLHDELRSRGHEAWVETRWVRPQRYATVALGCLLAVAGGLLAIAVPAAGLVVAVVGAGMLALGAAGRALPLYPRRATQDVVTEPRGTTGAIEARDERLALVIAAAYDAPRRGLVLNDRWRRRLRPRWGLVACAVAVAATAGARLAGVEATWLGAVQLVPTVILLVAFAAAVDIALSGFSPGANDNASGVAVAMALLDELQHRPPQNLAPALLLAGAGHAVRRRAEGVLLELGPCGAGRPVWSARHPQLRAAAGRAAEALGHAEGGRRSRGVRIACVDERGLAPRAHQEDDTVVDAGSMEAALDLALGVVDAFDAELSAAGRAASRPA